MYKSFLRNYSDDFHQLPMDGGEVDIQSIEITAIADLRRHARVDAYILAEVFTERGDKVIGIVTNISLSGLRMEGSQQIVEALFPDLNKSTTHKDVLIDVYFNLPANQVKAKARCKALYTLYRESYIYNIGMEFINIDEGFDELMKILPPGE